MCKSGRCCSKGLHFTNKEDEATNKAEENKSLDVDLELRAICLICVTYMFHMHGFIIVWMLWRTHKILLVSYITEVRPKNQFR